MYYVIIHKCIEIVDKNIELFSTSPINKKTNMFIFTTFFWVHSLGFFYVITKNINADGIFLPILWIILNLTVNFISLKSSLLPKLLSAFVITHRLPSAGDKYPTKHNLKHSLLSIFWISMNPFSAWFKSFGNLIYYCELRGCTLKY